MNELPVQKRKAILLVLSLLSLALALSWFKRIAGPAGSQIFDLDQISPSFNSCVNGGHIPAAQPISINTANIEELCRLTGIGPVKARQIIEYRQEHGQFKELKDLQKVKGIGLKTFEKIVKQIIL